MEYVTWTDDYSVGVFLFDEDHKKLIGYINELNRCLECSLSPPEIKNVVDGLVDYTYSHFGREEELMQKYSYPFLPEHKKEHNDLMIKIKNLKGRLDHKDPGIATELKSLMRTWLIHHVLNIDMKYKRFFSEKGID